jgi:hypothetical protein
MTPLELQADPSAITPTIEDSLVPPKGAVGVALFAQEISPSSHHGCALLLDSLFFNWHTVLSSSAT